MDKYLMLMCLFIFFGEKTGIKNTDSDEKYDIIGNAATINISW